MNCSAEKLTSRFFFTGVGFRYLMQALGREFELPKIYAALAAIPTAVRGPKPVAAMREVGLTPNVIAPSPNTWRELFAAIDEKIPVRGKRVAVQEYGEPNDEFLDALRERGAEILQVPIYRWDLPVDIAPLHTAISKIIAGEIDVALFTSAQQIENIFRVAEQAGIAKPLHAAFQKIVIASVGPVCSDALRRHKLAPDIEPQSPKMGPLILAVVERAREILKSKRD
jgi:uroporphyrinogen-III synthase